jgi:hypothetical protein
VVRMSGAISEARFSVAALRIIGSNIFRECQYAPVPLEFDPVGGIGDKLDFARFCSKAGNYISKWTPSLKLRHQ